MKTILFAFVAAILIAGQCFSPVAAAASPSVLASSTCGDTYIVQPFDWLAKIADTCGTTISEILVLNPQIVNPNLIYSGQVLRLTGNAPVTYWPTTTGYARVSLSTTWALAGSGVSVYVSGFPVNTEIDYRLGRQGESFSVVYDGKTTASGTASQVITIPTVANIGEYWVVQVITTSLANVVSVTSHTIYVGAYSPYTPPSWYAWVSLSTTQAKAGDTVNVGVHGFPAKSEIDYRVGKLGASFSLVYDGTVGTNGATSQVITIPATAAAGEYWVVEVVTTSLAKVTSVTSHTIYITD
jgi:LysM repeat protein